MKFLSATSYLSVGSKLKDNVLKFGRFEVVRMVQIGIITWPLGPAGRGPRLNVKTLRFISAPRCRQQSL